MEIVVVAQLTDLQKHCFPCSEAGPVISSCSKLLWDSKQWTQISEERLLRSHVSSLGLPGNRVLHPSSLQINLFTFSLSAAVSSRHRAPQPSFATWHGQCAWQSPNVFWSGKPLSLVKYVPPHPNPGSWTWTWQLAALGASWSICAAAWDQTGLCQQDEASHRKLPQPCRTEVLEGQRTVNSYLNQKSHFIGM